MAVADDTKRNHAEAVREDECTKGEQKCKLQKLNSEDPQQQQQQQQQQLDNHQPQQQKDTKEGYE